MTPRPALLLLGPLLAGLLLACGGGAPTSRPAPTVGPTAALDPTPAAPQLALKIVEFPVPAGEGPHDVAPAPDGRVWYTAQRTGELGVLDPRTGSTHQVKLGAGSSPHGVIVGPDGAPWVTDSGLNAIVRVDPVTDQVLVYPLPSDRSGANLNTATFDKAGALWFTGQSGVFGRLDPASGKVEVFDAPGGAGPYGINTTPAGQIFYASLAGSHIAQVDVATAKATRLRPPTAGQGARRVWPDSSGRVWVSEWNAGKVAVYDPASESWKEWRLPGSNPMAYAVYVDEDNIVWLSDFGGDAIVRFDPVSQEFTSLPLPSRDGSVRQILGRPGEIWAAESASDKLILIRTKG